MDSPEVGQGSSGLAMLPFCLLISNPSGEDARDALKAALVEQILSEIEFPLTTSQLSEQVGRELGLAGPYSVPEVQIGIERAKRDGTVEPVGRGKRYQLTALGHENASQRKVAARLARHAFDAHIDAAITGSPGVCGLLTQGQRDEIIAALKTDLQNLLRRRANEAAGYVWTGESLGHLVDDSRLNNLNAVLSSVSPDPLTAQELLFDIVRSLEDLPEHGRVFVSSLYRRVFYGRMAMLDPTYQQLQMSLISEWTLYLDCNVLIADLVVRDRKHREVCAVLDRCRQAGSSLRVSPFTASEFAGRLWIADRRWNQFTSGTGGNVVEGLVRKGREPFISEYLSGYTAITWDEYLNRYRDIESRLSAKHITLDCEAESVDLGNLDDLRDAVFRAKADRMMFSFPELVDHDARNIRLVELVRGRSPASPAGHRVWFLTLDRSLRHAEKVLGHTPKTILIQELLSLATALSIPDLRSMGEDEYAALLVDSVLGDLVPGVQDQIGDYLERVEQLGVNMAEASPEELDRLMTELATDNEISTLLRSDISDPDQRKVLEDRMKTLAGRLRDDSGSSRVESLENMVQTLHQRVERESQERSMVEQRLERERRAALYWRKAAYALVVVIGLIAIWAWRQ